MKRFLLLLAAVSLFPVLSVAQTADEVVGKALAARGGLAKIKAVKSERISGSISFGPEVGGPFEVELSRPGRMHMEITLAQGKVVRVYDGKGTGWVILPFGENRGVQPMSDEDIKNINEESDFDGPFIDAKEKGNKVDYVGEETLDGKPAYRLKLTMKNGSVRDYWVDRSSFLLLKWQGTRKQDDKDITVESVFKDYRDVDGLKFAFTIESGLPGGPAIQRIVLQKVEIDPKIEEARFAKPANPNPPAAAPSN